MKAIFESSTMKRFFLFNIKHLSYLLKALLIISLVLVAYFYRGTIEKALIKIGIEKEDNLEVAIFSVFLGFLITQLVDMFRITSIQRRVSQWLIRANTNVDSHHLTQIRDYNDTLSSRIRNLLPEELKPAWLQATIRNRYIIPLRAEELISPGLKGIRPGFIKDLLLFLDIEFFAKVEERLPPITIQGDPGSGKSTLIFELYRQQASRLKEQGQGWIPIIIFAHELSWDLLRTQQSLRNLLIDYFKKSFSKHDPRGGYDSISHLLQEQYDRYQFLIIIDGLDEITNRQLYEDITRKLNELLEKEWKAIDGRSNVNRYVVTCRTDDNQRIITSRLISLLPLPYEHTLKHLYELHRFYKRKNDLDNKQRTDNIIGGLKASKANRLLQNYISNPYLLSIIVKYYEERGTFQARTLNRVFEGVLERELRKPREEFEEEVKQETRAQLRPYLGSLLAPYCYRRTLDTLLDERNVERDFKSYLEEDNTLSEILFGSGQNIGYLQSIINNNIQAREDGFLALAKLWGDEKAYQFRRHLDALNSEALSHDEFIERAVKYLHKDILDLLDRFTLAEVDKENWTIKRFRHRRMQDYFMALFLDQVGISTNGAPRILLDNAWMREPVRILAAISSRPEDLLSSFIKEYENQNASGNGRSNDGSIKKIDLLLNASEAVAYLPKPRIQESDQTLYKLVIRLGLEAQRLYHKIAYKVEVNNVQSARKCLTMLRNVYASEFLRGDDQVFKTRFYFGDEAGDNYWKALHNDLQESPGFYQHIAYSYLYPIKRVQKHFPISSLSLFFYVMDAVLCFPHAYDRLIKETHPERHSRILFKLGSFLETIISIVIIGMLLSIPWYLKGIFPSWEFKLVTSGILASMLAVFALAAHWYGLMEWTEFYHIVTWVPLKIFKWTWPILKYLIMNLSKTLKDLAGYIKEKASQLFKWIVRHPVQTILTPLLLIVLVFGAIQFQLHVIPYMEYSYGKWKYESATDQFIQQTEEFLTHQQDTITQANEFINQMNEIMPEKRKQVMSMLDSRKDAAIGLINNGQYLVETGKAYSEARRDEISSIVQQLTKERDSIANLKSQIISKEEDIRYATRLIIFRKKAGETDRAMEELTTLSPDTSSVSEMQSYLEKLNSTIASADDLTKEGESLAKDNPGSVTQDDPSPVIQKIKNKQLLLKERASQTSNEIERAAAAPSAVVDPDVVEKARTASIQRSQEALNRTTLNDIKDKLPIINEYIQTGPSKLQQMKLEVRSLHRGWEALPKYLRVDDYLNYINQMNAIGSDTPLMQQQLVEYGKEIDSILNGTSDIAQFDEWRTRLKEQSLKIKVANDQILAFNTIHQEYIQSHIQDNLTVVHEEVSNQLFTQFSFVTMLAILVALIGLVFVLYKRFISDKRGEREVENIRGDFGNLLRFIKSNGYSFQVNSRAIAYLREVAPQSSEGWRRISEIAWARHNMPGDKNEKIGRSLDEVAIGIDNILNHQLPG